MAVTTKTAAKTPTKTSKAAPAKAAAKGGNVIKQAAAKIREGCMVKWNQRTRTGEKTYFGMVFGPNENGKRMVKLTNGNGKDMAPREEWLTVQA